MRPVLMIKREIVNGLDINPHNVKDIWKNEYLKEKLSEKGFVENEEVWTAYKTFTDEILFVGVEREADRSSKANQGSSKQS
jgi:hypothetical protein